LHSSREIIATLKRELEHLVQLVNQSTDVTAVQKFSMDESDRNCRMKSAQRAGKFGNCRRIWRLRNGYLKTPLVSMDAVNFTQTPFLAGFVMDEKNNTVAEEQMTIMKGLAPKLPQFAPLLQEKVPGLVDIGEVRFVVWKGGFEKAPQILGGELVWNEARLAARLGEIAAGGGEKDSLEQTVAFDEPISGIVAKYERKASHGSETECSVGHRFGIPPPFP
jgi:hypothetical protein